MIFINFQQNFNMDILGGTMDGILKGLLEMQLEHEKKGDYVEADKCKVKFEEQKEAFHKKYLADMNARHKQERNDLNDAWAQELSSFNNFWDDKMNQFNQQSNNMEQELKKKHNDELEKTKAHLDETMPIKLKESSELLNLRKMEEHMVKQKNYQEAHTIQTKANALCAKETQLWMINRKNKIDTSINTLKAKQNTELTNFQKRVATSRAEKNRDRKNEEDKINLKYENFMNDLKKNQEKEALAFKGQFKQLGGTAKAISSPNKAGSSIANMKKSS